MNAQNPVFTIVTVTLNCNALLERTIESVLKQEFVDYEYIVVDGGSTDGSIDTIKRYEKNITSWSSERDAGIYDAMNKAAAKAHGKWIIFLNAGDTFCSPEVLSTVADRLEDSGLDVIYGDIMKMRDGAWALVPAHEPRNYHHIFFCHQAAFVRTELMRQMPFERRFRYSADFYFFKKCWKDGRKFLHLNEAIACYDTSGVSNREREKALRENIAVVKELDRGVERLVFVFRLRFTILGVKLSHAFKNK